MDIQNPKLYTVYDAQWQCVRVDLLGKWNDMKGLEDNLDKCMVYANAGTTNLFSRTWRVINCLNAVVMGWHGQGVARFAHHYEVLKFDRNIHQRVHAREKARGEQFQQFLDYSEVDDDHLYRIHKNLTARWVAHANHFTRGDLRAVLDIIDMEVLKREAKGGSGS
jgi:hypothetical protein